MNIYVASSWRNEYQPTIVVDLREHGFEVYDFRNPAPGDTGFQWSEVDPKWKLWEKCPERFVKALQDPIAKDGFKKDIAAMYSADVFVLAMPCGRSAHLELGWAIGREIPSFILLPPDCGEPELMYSMAKKVCTSMAELLRELHALCADDYPCRIETN